MTQISQRAKQELRVLIEFGTSPRGAFVLAMLGVLLSLYALWAADKKTEISQALILRTPVINQGANAPKLELVFEGRRIDPSTEFFNVALIRVWNSGETTIRVSDYDPNTPLGFSVLNAQIVSVGLEHASNEYLAAAAKPQLAPNELVQIPAVILEPRDALLYKLYVLQRKNEELQLKPTGKVAGLASVAEMRPLRVGGDGPIKEFVPKAGLFIPRNVILAFAALLLANLARALLNEYKRFKAGQRPSAGEPTGQSAKSKTPDA